MRCQSVPVVDFVCAFHFVSQSCIVGRVYLYLSVHVRNVLVHSGDPPIEDQLLWCILGTATVVEAKMHTSKLAYDYSVCEFIE